MWAFEGEAEQGRRSGSVACSRDGAATVKSPNPRSGINELQSVKDAKSSGDKLDRPDKRGFSLMVCDLTEVSPYTSVKITGRCFEYQPAPKDPEEIVPCVKSQVDRWRIQSG